MTTATEPTLFTPESANRALPYVRAIVDDVVEAFSRLEQAERTRAMVMAGNPSVGETQRERDVALADADEIRTAARATLVRVTKELQAVGVELKDPGAGLVDFPGEIDGRRVYLCWKRGEESVDWFHAAETGFAGRERIPAPEPASEM